MMMRKIPITHEEKTPMKPGSIASPLYISSMSRETGFLARSERLNGGAVCSVPTDCSASVGVTSSHGFSLEKPLDDGDI